MTARGGRCSAQGARRPADPRTPQRGRGRVAGCGQAEGGVAREDCVTRLPGVGARGI